MNENTKKLSPLTEASYYVLLAFYEDNHGYGVIKKVEDLTKGRLKLAAGTLYGVINTLFKHNLINLQEFNGLRSKKTYKITKEGIELLQYELNRLEEMVRNAQEVLL